MNPIDKLIEKGLLNHQIMKLGYSLSTIKYRRAKLKSPVAYRNLIKRSSKNNAIYKKKLSTRKLEK